MWRETCSAPESVRCAPHFNPLPPCGGRRNKIGRVTHLRRISIHSLRVEGDNEYSHLSLPCSVFQSTPSVWRETSINSDFISSAFRFQSTPSVWRETGTAQKWASGEHISIHSLRVEGDLNAPEYLVKGINFNPLPPCGGRQSCSNFFLPAMLISIHSLRVEGDMVKCPQRKHRCTISIHSLRVEGDQANMGTNC